MIAIGIIVIIFLWGISLDLEAINDTLKIAFKISDENKKEG